MRAHITGKGNGSETEYSADFILYDTVLYVCKEPNDNGISQHDKERNEI